MRSSCCMSTYSSEQWAVGSRQWAEGRRQKKREFHAEAQRREARGQRAKAKKEVHPRDAENAEVAQRRASRGFSRMNEDKTKQFTQRRKGAERSADFADYTDSGKNNESA